MAQSQFKGTVLRWQQHGSSSGRQLVTLCLLWGKHSQRQQGWEAASNIVSAVGKAQQAAREAAGHIVPAVRGSRGRRWLVLSLLS